MKCTKCEKEADEKYFATYYTKSRELRRRRVCWECRSNISGQRSTEAVAYRKQYNVKIKTKQQSRNAARRAAAKEFVNSKKAGPCADCGRSFPPVAMDFDHISPDKYRPIANLVSGGFCLRIIELELAKCELVCACCHRLRTAARGENHAPRIAGNSMTEARRGSGITASTED